ncbi:MAG: hypothetical protein M1822_001773 [Bathelium mastoideum]|nr:MAG: hypothetical protein M1822_001773 [Bathelium mastoideum]
MSSVYSFVFPSGSEEGERSIAQQAAFQATHDEQVSRAFNDGAAYALIRVFECGCYYIDRHAYQSSSPGRKADPFSTFTSVHDFLRGPCFKSRCADFDCPTWWYTEEGKSKYGTKDTEDCNELLGETEEWEARVAELVADYRTLLNPIKEQLHDLTYAHQLEKMAWLLMCPPMWDQQMLVEWCPEISDVKEWQRRAADMATTGAPREWYEFCIDAAWESMKAVRSKVRSELEEVVQELQRRHDYVTAHFGIPQDLILPPTPDSPASPGTVPRFSTSEVYTPNMNSANSRDEAPVHSEVASMPALESEVVLEHDTSAVQDFPEYAEAPTVAEAPNTSDVDYFNQPGMVPARLFDNPTYNPFLVTDSPREVSRQVSILRPTTRSYVSVPTPTQWREVFPDTVTGAEPETGNAGSTRLSAPEMVTSTVRPNVRLPSPAVAALYDAFASTDSVSSWDAASVRSREASVKSQLRTADNHDDGQPVDNRESAFESDSWKLEASTSSFDSVVPTNSEDPEDSSSIFEPRPAALPKSLDEEITSLLSRSQEDTKDESKGNLATRRAQKLSRASLPPALKGLPSYADLRELTGMRLHKVTVSEDYQGFNDMKSASSISSRIVTTTFLIYPVHCTSAIDAEYETAYVAGAIGPFSSPPISLSPPSSASDGGSSMHSASVDALPEIAVDDYHASVMGSEQQPITPAGPSRSTAPSLTDKSIEKSNVFSRHSSLKTRAKPISWIQGLRNLKPWRLFQRHCSNASKGNNNGPTKLTKKSR